MLFQLESNEGGVLVLPIELKYITEANKGDPRLKSMAVIVTVDGVRSNVSFVSVPVNDDPVRGACSNIVRLTQVMHALLHPRAYVCASSLPSKTCVFTGVALLYLWVLCVYLWDSLVSVRASVLP